jgi:hypothetical protein
MADGLRPVDPEYLHAAVRVALENLQRLEGEARAAGEAQEAAQQAVWKAESRDEEHVARQKVAGEKLTPPDNAKKAKAALENHELVFRSSRRAIEIAGGEVVDAVAEHLPETRTDLNKRIELEHDQVSEMIEDIIPRVERVAAVVEARNWIEWPTREQKPPELRGCPPIPIPAGYRDLVNVLQAALQPGGAAEPSSPYETFRETMRLANEAHQLVRNGQAEWPAGEQLLRRAENPNRNLAETRALRDAFRAMIDHARRHPLEPGDREGEGVGE